MLAYSDTHKKSLAHLYMLQMHQKALLSRIKAKRKILIERSMRTLQIASKCSNAAAEHFLESNTCALHASRIEIARKTLPQRIIENYDSESEFFILDILSVCLSESPAQEHL